MGCCAHSAAIFVITFSPSLLRYNTIAIPLLLTIYNVRFRVAFMCPHVTPMRTIYPEFHESSPRRRRERRRRSNRAPHLSSAYVLVYSYRLKPSRVTWANTCYNNAIKEKNKRKRERNPRLYYAAHLYGFDGFNGSMIHWDPLMLGRSVFVSSLPFAHGESITRFWSLDSFLFLRYERKYSIL